MGTFHGKVIKPKLKFSSQEFYSKHIKKKFADLSEELNEPLLSAYANNFYECTVRNLASYLETLEQILDENSFDKIIILESVKSKLPTSFYFLAEHESQGRFLYKRGFFFGY